MKLLTTLAKELARIAKSMKMDMGIDELENISFVDCNCWIGGNYLNPKFSVGEAQLDKIIEDRQENYNIKVSIISHHTSLFYWAREGNDILAGLLKDKPGISGAMLMEHEFISEPENFEAGLKKRFEQGFRFVRLFPKSNKYPFEANLLPTLYDVLNHYRFPVMIGLEEIDITGNKYIEWDKIASIAKAYSNLPIIIEGQNAKCLLYNSYFLSLLVNFENIYLTSHNLFSINQIENLVGKTSSKKILFDTYFPYLEVNLAVKRLLLSSLKLQDKERIAHKNIEEIIQRIEF